MGRLQGSQTACPTRTMASSQRMAQHLGGRVGTSPPQSGLGRKPLLTRASLTLQLARCLGLGLSLAAHTQSMREWRLAAAAPTQTLLLCNTPPPLPPATAAPFYSCAALQVWASQVWSSAAPAMARSYRAWLAVRPLWSSCLIHASRAQRSPCTMSGVCTSTSAAVACRACARHGCSRLASWSTQGPRSWHFQMRVPLCPLEAPWGPQIARQHVLLCAACMRPACCMGTSGVPTLCEAKVGRSSWWILSRPPSCRWRAATRAGWRR
mmetsp:Transcript_21031/g.53443  ORF Transcript_21031/g.53443 Transcript_21031/m.53443 type:complete len:266 (+) Transcript_21031:126-923(+)